jgi:hypothetical protein
MMTEHIGHPHLEYLERAAECRRRADTALSPAARKSFLEAESRWFAVAQTYAAPEQTVNVENYAEDSEQR